jgi:hypothetical protein
MPIVKTDTTITAREAVPSTADTQLSPSPAR